jgi:hypothetical protein
VNLESGSAGVLEGIDWSIDVNDDIVRRSKNAALVGSSGIVVQETENTFKVVTRKNKSKGAWPGSCVPSCFRALSMHHASSHSPPFLSIAKAGVRLRLRRPPI